MLVLCLLSGSTAAAAPGSCSCEAQCFRDRTTWLGAARRLREAGKSVTIGPTRIAGAERSFAAARRQALRPSHLAIGAH